MTNNEQAAINIVDKLFGGVPNLEELEDNDQQFQQQLDQEEQEWSELQEKDNENM